MNESNTSSSIGYSLDFRKNSGCCFFCRERFLPEQASGRDCHLRRSLVRLRTASASVPSSGQHSLTGVETITSNRNSGERPVPRRRAPAPLRVVFAGAGERTKLLPPPSPCSSEDSFHIRAQLRLTFSRRRKSNYRQPNSGEKGVPRRKALAPIRVVLAGAGVHPSGCKRSCFLSISCYNTI